MRDRSAVRVLASVPIALLLCAPPARAELAAWDQAKVGALAKELEATTSALYDTFVKQPTPGLGSMQSRTYYRLKQEVRRIRSEARELAGSLEKGEGHEQTQPIYESLMQLVREARDDARQVFTTRDVEERAAAVRAVLNQLGPYYDPDFQTLQPVTR
jgi:hypothetical protein